MAWERDNTADMSMVLSSLRPPMRRAKASAPRIVLGESRKLGQKGAPDWTVLLLTSRASITPGTRVVWSARATTASARSRAFRPGAVRFD